MPAKGLEGIGSFKGCEKKKEVTHLVMSWD